MIYRVGAVSKVLFINLLGSVVWFPAWWYSKGLVGVTATALSTLSYRSKSFGFAIWIKNFFVPMYGQYDITGRAVSVFMRLIVLVGRAIALGIEALLYGLGLAAWLIAPPVFFLMLLTNLAAGAF